MLDCDYMIFELLFMLMVANSSDLRQKIDAIREEEPNRLAASERMLRDIIQQQEDSLIEVKAERNSYRSKANSLSREIVQGEVANSKRLALIADLRLELTIQKAEIKVRHCYELLL